MDGHLHGVEAWRVVGVCELLPAAGEDLVDGEAAEVVSPQEPVQHVVQHAGGADLAILLDLPESNKSYWCFQLWKLSKQVLSWCPG